MSVAAPLILRPGDGPKLESLLRSSTVRAGLAQRARIVLLASEGVSNAEIARRVGVARQTVIDWRACHEASRPTSMAGTNPANRSSGPNAADQILDNARAQQSGVSIDEEMTNLVQFQHGYDAAARLMTTIDGMLDTLINHTGV